MDLTGFYATVSGVGFTLLGLWWVVVDKHPEWSHHRESALMAYVVSLQFMIPATSSLLSLVSTAEWIWRAVFTLLGVVGMGGAVLVSRNLASRPGVSAVVLLAALPVYVAIIAVALFPGVGSVVALTGLQLEALLVAMVLVLGMHAVWFFSHRVPSPPD